MFIMTPPPLVDMRINTPKGYYLFTTGTVHYSDWRVPYEYQYPEGLLPVYYNPPEVVNVNVSIIVSIPRRVTTCLLHGIVDQCNNVRIVMYQYPEGLLPVYYDDGIGEATVVINLSSRINTPKGYYLFTTRQNWWHIYWARPYQYPEGLLPVYYMPVLEFFLSRYNVSIPRRVTTCLLLQGLRGL